MKNFLICLLILVVIFGGGGGYFFVKNILEDKKIEKIKDGWYVEITNEYINVRDDANTKAKILGEVSKGEIYEVLDINLDNSSYFWYKIDYNGNEAWIASNRTKPYVNDFNNPNDIKTPVIKYKDDIYKVVSIDDINYKHLEVIDDKNDYEITHVIYREYKPNGGDDQYWILYKVTDGSGKSSSKLQKIEFEETPKDEEFLDFEEYNK